jgi:DNA modification methylase
LKLYTNENDIVFTPFMGIGSEVYEAVKNGRRGLGIELKETYYKCAIDNLESLETEKQQMSIFDFLKG